MTSGVLAEWQNFVHTEVGRRVGLCFVIAVVIALALARGARENFAFLRRNPTDDGGPADESWSSSSPEARATLFSVVSFWLTEPARKKIAWALLAGTTLHWLVREATWAYLDSANMAELTNSLTALHESQDMSRVQRALLALLLWRLVWISPLMAVVDPLINSWMQLDLRNSVTRQALNAYFIGGGKAYYRLKLEEGENGIDNPDQRIAEDVDRISSFFVNFYGSILSALFGCSMWVHVLISLASPNVATVCVAACVLRTCLAFYGFREVLVHAKRRVLHSGANFRYGLMRVRDAAEEVALVDGSQREHSQAEGLYGRVINAVWYDILVHVRYGYTLGLVSEFPHVILWVLMLSDILSGKLGIGDAQRVIFAYDQVSKVLGFVVDNFGIFTDLAADAERLHGLLSKCETANGDASGIETEEITYKDVDSSEALRLESVMVFAGAATGSLGGVSLSLASGQGLLVTIMFSSPRGGGK